MKKSTLALSVAAAMIVALAACGPTPQTVYAPQPQIVQQAPVVAAPVAAAPVVVQQDSGVGTLATGMMLGHMMSGGSRGYDSHTSVNRTTVVNKTVVVQQAPRTATPAAAPAPTRSFSGSSYGAMRSSSGLSGSRSSTSFSSSRSSFSSFGGRR